MPTIAFAMSGGGYRGAFAAHISTFRLKSHIFCRAFLQGASLLTAFYGNTATSVAAKTDGILQCGKAAEH